MVQVGSRRQQFPGARTAIGRDHRFAAGKRLDQYIRKTLHIGTEYKAIAPAYIFKGILFKPREDDLIHHAQVVHFLFQFFFHDAPAYKQQFAGKVLENKKSLDQQQVVLLLPEAAYIHEVKRVRIKYIAGFFIHMRFDKVQVDGIVDHPYRGFDPEVLHEIGLHGIGIRQHQVGPFIREHHHELGEHAVNGGMALLHGGLVCTFAHDHMTLIAPEAFHQGIDITGTVQEGHRNMDVVLFAVPVHFPGDVGQF